ncbi:MvaI/BcnI restriction endonuclease family protein [Nocardioides alpinus]|uniref:MvaI/BcnI restriction endonuclease family protein n=1 Tax=Nocardioides alpinus TaxID=748909 RepID=A0A1I0VXX6_9ACTN|nr:MvaI/BcnI family restriction endonuclease [Nocardioides alpinus]PKH37551.1 hypothetical protein CXG46_19115 [Nocardioides alpinus]SFA81124.1 MvaI/BcnI restriction endonuclease family protein [Nocardioides alpinus]
MLSNATFQIERALNYFADHDLEVGFLSPTATGLEKSIMDAHGDLRAFLRDAGVHDFDSQGQGPEAKVIVEATFLGDLEAPDTSVSLYRPRTKAGDPRIWVRGLREWATPGNLLALFVIDQHLYITNLSDPSVWEAREDPDSPLGAVVCGFASEEDIVADELLGKLRGIARMGWVASQRVGDTGIGFTLESLLGIAANSSRSPDYKGIELKSARRAGGRNNLFAKTPDWSRSPVSRTADLLAQHGYYASAKDRRQLFATVYATHATPAGFSLDAGDADTWLTRSGKNLAVWSNAELRQSLQAKHASTFWVKATSRLAPDGTEEFLFDSVRYTRSPLVSAFVPLVRAGGITVDLTCFEQDGGAAKDKGYLWKVTQTSFGSLFPKPAEFVL